MNGEFWMAVIQGVVGTLLVSGLVFMGRGILGRLLALIPGLEPASVRGTWDTKWWKEEKEEDTGKVKLEEHTEVVKLKQFLHYVWGTVKYTRPDGKERNYKLRGRIKQRVFVATYEIKGDPAALDLGSFTVRMPDAFGNTMKGKYSWPDDRSQKCISGVYKWKKREDENEKVEVE